MGAEVDRFPCVFGLLKSTPLDGGESGFGDTDETQVSDDDHLQGARIH